MQPVEYQEGVRFIAYQDAETDMLPVAEQGRRVLFDDLEAARAGAGILGVAAPVTWDRVAELCEVHGLRLPKNGTE